MKLNRKVKSFTLSEMVVVLILTSIVVGLAFSVLTLVQKQMSAIQLNYQKNLTINKLETALWLDFSNSSKVNYDNLNNELKFSSEVDSTTYKFVDNFIVRGSDTFSVNTQSKKLYLQGEIKESGTVDALKIEFSKDYQGQKLFIFKTNDAAIFMND